MNPPTLPRFLLAMATAMALLGTPVYAQDSTAGAVVGQILGVVVDSTAGGPLVDAAVVLWGTPHRTVTDEEGRFAFQDLEPGRYSLTFFHTRLGELGISSGATPVELDPGESVEVALGTPSWFTVVASQCLLEGTQPGKGIVAGWVGDGDSGMGMPGAKIHLAWPASGSREPARVELETDATGWYRMCDAPSDTPVLTSARFLNLQGLRREVVVSEGGMAKASFLLWEVKPAKVSGAVHDATSNLGVEGAEVWLRGTSIRTLTDDEGSFRFGDVPPGTYTMVADHLQYGTRQDTLVVPAGRTLTVDMRVDSKAIELDPLTVEVEAVPVPRRIRGGRAITRQQIEKIGNRARDTADLLQALQPPGVIVRRRGDGTLCVGYQPGQVRLMAFGSCVSMEVYINGVHTNDAESAFHIPPEAVDRIVLFRPIEAGNLFPTNSANGVMVIYTRR